MQSKHHSFITSLLGIRHIIIAMGANGRRIEGGIISFEAPIHVSNVQLVTKIDGKEVITRVGYQRINVTKRRSASRPARVRWERGRVPLTPRGMFRSAKRWSLVW